MRTVCTKCGGTSPAVEFYDASGKKSWCKGCHRAAVKANDVKRRAEDGRPPREERGAYAKNFGRELTGVDLVPCARCGLRGHVAGDPDRCLRASGAAGIGSQAWLLETA